MSDTKTTLAATANWTAAVRAVETKRPDRLFEDAWATALAGEIGSTWIQGRAPESLAPIVLRTRYFDDYLKRITESLGIRQIVLLGAGLDTRAYRLNWPDGTTLYEVDQPDLLEYKENILQAQGARPQCRRVVVKTDLKQEWAIPLRRAGYEAAKPSGWLIEGLLFYLPTQVVTSLLTLVSGITARGSWLGFDIINGETLTSPFTKRWIEMQQEAGAPWIGTLDDPVAFLAQAGWRAELTQAGQPEANHGRWTLPIIPTTMPNMPHNWFVVAQKGDSDRG